MNIQDEQDPILQEIANALVVTTPTHWVTATLDLIRNDANGIIGLEHKISNTQFPHDIVVATDELMEATNKLDLLHEEHNQKFRRLLFQIRKDDDSWHYDASWEY